jgi:hypothetical protein
MSFGRMAALAAGASLAACAAGAATLQVILTNGLTGHDLAWDQSSAPVGAPGRPFETIDPVSHFEVSGAVDAAVTTVEVSDGAVSSRMFNNAVRGETDTVTVTGAPVSHPSIWAMMLASFDGLGRALRRIAASA